MLILWLKRFDVYIYIYIYTSNAVSVVFYVFTLWEFFVTDESVEYFMVVIIPQHPWLNVTFCKQKQTESELETFGVY